METTDPAGRQAAGFTPIDSVAPGQVERDGEHALGHVGK